MASAKNEPFCALNIIDDEYFDFPFEALKTTCFCPYFKKKIKSKKYN